MSDTSPQSKVDGTEDDVMKEALLTQHKIIQKLYNELEEEREASTIAVSEALSMILRLQEERAAERLEANQYKRMAEEKISHAEESLVILEEIIYQKDMEISSLELHIETYKQNISRVGLGSVNFEDGETPNTTTLPRNVVKRRNVNVHRVTRNNSFPVFRSKSSRFDRTTCEISKCLSSPKQPSPQKTYCPRCLGIIKKNRCEELLDEQIEKLSLSYQKNDEDIESRRVLTKEYNKDLVFSLQDDTSNCSWSSALTSDHFNDSKKEIENKSIHESTQFCSDSQTDYESLCVESLDIEESGNPMSSASVHDIFEVTEDPRIHKLEYERRDKTEIFSKNSQNYMKLDDEWINSSLLCAQTQNNISQPGKEDCDYFHPPIDQRRRFNGSTEIQNINTRLQLLEQEKRIAAQDALRRQEEE